MTDSQQTSTPDRGTEDDTVAQRAQAMSGPGDNHDVGTDGDEESAADRENGQ